jgi:hypothetical protein
VADQYKDIELTNGMTVRIYRPPYTRVHASVRMRYPEPEPPTVETVTGRSIPNPADPEYLERHAEWQEQYAQAVEDMRALFLFKDLPVPDGWDVESEVGAEMRYFDPDWKPREGPMGRKLDYIQWAVLGDVMNAKRVTDAEAEMSGIDLQEVAANEASFQDQVEGEVPQ